MQIKSWLEWLYPCTIMRKLSALFDIGPTVHDNLDAGIAGTYISLIAMFDIGEHNRQDLDNCDEDSAEKKEDESESTTMVIERERPGENDKVEEEEEDYYEMVEPPDGQYFEAVNEIYAEIGGGGYKRDLSSCASESSGSEEGDNAIVTAKPAIVMEDQIDSLSYVGYDDIAGSLPRGLSKGGLYEDIAGSLLNLARIKSGDEDIAKAESAAVGDPDEMLSYTLAKLSEASNNNSSAADSGDKSSDEWVDLDDDEEEETDDYDTTERLVRNKGLVR